MTSTKKQIAHPLDDLLRTDRIPHIWCPGCGIGTAFASCLTAMKASGIDLAPLLAPAQKPREDTGVYCQTSQDHGLDRALDNTHLIRLSKVALEKGERVEFELPINNTHRTVGTLLSHQIVKRWGEFGLPDDTIHARFGGSAGQSFGAWLARGVTLELVGDANDYVGKGLSGGYIVVYPPPKSSFVPEHNILVGNVVLYGATGGRAFFRGAAAERFAIRNSGVWTVVEGVGAHGCEYMTGGKVVVLGKTGVNFAAGMSGGLAYVFDDQQLFDTRCNLDMVDLEFVHSDDDKAFLFETITKHYEHTNSSLAKWILENWDAQVGRFVKVFPVDYRKALARMKNKAQRADDFESPGEEVFSGEKK